MTDRDLADAVWRKSTRSGGASGGGGSNCVEVAHGSDRVAMRDSKNPTGPAMSFTPAKWDTFRTAIKGGVFDRV